MFQKETKILCHDDTFVGTTITLLLHFWLFAFTVEPLSEICSVTLVELQFVVAIIKA